MNTATIHSLERAKERIGCNKKNAEKQIERALVRGKKADDFTSWEKSFLQGESSETTTAIAYNNYCYIVSSDGMCVTLYPLPVWFGKKKHFDGKEKIRNMKVYARNYRTADAEQELCIV